MIISVPPREAVPVRVDVPSRSEPWRRHRVTGTPMPDGSLAWGCPCPGFGYRNRCSHVTDVSTWLGSCLPSVPHFLMPPCDSRKN